MRRFPIVEEYDFRVEAHSFTTLTSASVCVAFRQDALKQDVSRFEQLSD